MILRPDAEQDRALNSQGSHILVVAPPGTGKTSLAVRMAERAVGRLESHQQVLLLTFSNQARGQLEREAETQLSAEVRRRVVVTNYHRLFWSAVRSYRRVLGLPDEVRITSGAKRRAIVLGASRAARAIPRALQESVAEFQYSELRPALPLTEEELAPILAVVAAEHRAGRLVFEDFGALWWRLITTQPTVLRALQARFPVVLADEHQDASALQDGLVRAIATKMVVFADPMQLIHEWRGADIARLDRHLAERDDLIELSTPHRWSGDPATGQWLLDVRERLLRHSRPGTRPAGVHETLTDPARGMNGQIAAVRFAIHRALGGHARSVAVMAFRNDDVSRVRDYLCRNGLYPAQLGVNHAFDMLVELVDELPDMTPARTATEIISTLGALIPGVDDAVGRARARLGTTASSKARCDKTSRLLLEAADYGYEAGPAGFFPGVGRGLETLRQAGHHVPARDVSRLYSMAASESELSRQLSLFERRLAAASHDAARLDRGVLTMTVHQSKGREFDHVVLFNATENAFNSTKEESRRLFYVAITRARAGWDIIAPRGEANALIKALG